MFVSKKKVVEKLFIEESKLLLTEQLGAGSYGTVWAGECFKKPVAVKLINNTPEGLSVDKYNDLQKEVRRMTESLHENIILAMGLSTYQGQLALVMELLDGDLEKLLIPKSVPRNQVETPSRSPRIARAKKREASFSLYRRLLMAKDAALGLNWLHSRDPAIIHRDVKLANLMYKKMGDNFVIKVADFGLAVVKPSYKKYLKGDAKGTPLTMAPEIMKEQNYSEKADVYSFGLCLWQIITCAPLFPDLKEYKQFERAICKQVRRPEIPTSILEFPELVELLQSCWSAEPKHRPDFHNIIMSLDDILVDVAIDDERGRAFWKSNFLNEEDILWEVFWPRLSEWLGLKGNEDLNYLGQICFKALLQDCHKDKKVEAVNIETFGRFLLWYGPLDPVGQGDRQANLAEKGETLFIDGDRRTADSMVYRLEALLRAPWFHGLIEHEEAVRRLEGKAPDTFLVRCSGTIPGQFAISRTVDCETNRIQSTRLAQSEEGFGESPNNSSSGGIAPAPTPTPTPSATLTPPPMVPSGYGSLDISATGNKPASGRGLRDSSEIIQTKRFESLSQLIGAILDELAWQHCPGSPFSNIFDEESNSNGLEDPYKPLNLRLKKKVPLPGSPLGAEKQGDT